MVAQAGLEFIILLPIPHILRLQVSITILSKM